ncbi:MAG: hypothetical protein D6752_01400 [Candidatus Nitrosothermus koennekii]|nr:MAG: hypothetical protein D6752_01400 [Candidatus Nitrosothermus koennekii]
MSMKSILAIIIGIGILASITTPAMAFPHASKIINFTISNGEERSIQIVLGHTREPTLALAPGIHDGMHHVQIIIRDAKTSLPINNADLLLDRYYFKDEKDYNKGDLNKAKTETGLKVRSVHGLPGQYTVRQILTHPGIYGYHIYGTITYFDGTKVSIDETKFCSVGGVRGVQGPYDTPDWRGGYGCTESVKDWYWPQIKGGPKDISFDLSSMLLLGGIVAIGGIVATRLLKK